MEDELRLEVDCKDGFTFAGDHLLTVGYWTDSQMHLHMQISACRTYVAQPRT
jgi:hypothetical protein